MNNICKHVKSSTSFLNQTEVERLTKQNPKHISGYKFVYNTPTQKLTPQQVADIVDLIILRTRKLHDGGADHDQIKKSLKLHNTGIELFANDSHPVLFEKISNPCTPPKVLMTIRQMIAVHESISNGTIDEDSALQAMQTQILDGCIKRKE